MNRIGLAQNLVRMAKRFLATSPGWEAYEAGKEYVSASGEKVKIRTIWVDARGMRPVVRVEYYYGTETGFRGPEESPYDTFVIMMRQDRRG